MKRSKTTQEAFEDLDFAMRELGRDLIAPVRKLVESRWGVPVMWIALVVSTIYVTASVYCTFNTRSCHPADTARPHQEERAPVRPPQVGHQFVEQSYVYLTFVHIHSFI